MQCSKHGCQLRRSEILYLCIAAKPADFLDKNAGQAILYVIKKMLGEISYEIIKFLHGDK